MVLSCGVVGCVCFPVRVRQKEKENIANRQPTWLTESLCALICLFTFIDVSITFFLKQMQRIIKAYTSDSLENLELIPAQTRTSQKKQHSSFVLCCTALLLCVLLFCCVHKHAVHIVSCI